jgi:hypothetical protein
MVHFADDPCLPGGTNSRLTSLTSNYTTGSYGRSPADVAQVSPLESLDNAKYPKGLFWAVEKGECDGGSGLTKTTGRACRER